MKKYQKAYGPRSGAGRTLRKQACPGVKCPGWMAFAPGGYPAPLRGGRDALRVTCGSSCGPEVRLAAKPPTSPGIHARAKAEALLPGLFRPALLLQPVEEIGCPGVGMRPGGGIVDQAQAVTALLVDVQVEGDAVLA